MGALLGLTEWSQLGLVAFTATLALAAAEPRSIRALGRLVHSGYAEAVLDNTGGVAAATASILLHAGLAGILAAHLPLLAQLGGLATLLPISTLIAAARYSGALILVSATVLLASRLLAAAKGYPVDTCALLLDALLAATAAAALAKPWTMLHWVLGLASSILACYALAKGHTRTAYRVLAERILRI